MTDNARPQSFSFTKEEVQLALCSIDSKNSFGADQLDPRLLLLAALL